MESKTTQVQAFLEDRGEYTFDCSAQVSKNRTGTGILRMADFNTLTEEANVLTKTIKKKYENFHKR